MPAHRHPSNPQPASAGCHFWSLADSAIDVDKDISGEPNGHPLILFYLVCHDSLDTGQLAAEYRNLVHRGRPAEWFTGAVRIDTLFQAPEPAFVQGASVTFEPVARTACHTHPLGQTLIVTAGCGWTQREGGSVEEILPGDVVWFAPGEKHWHGATPTIGMTHIAIQEKLEGKVVNWLEHVTDEQYRK